MLPATQKARIWSISITSLGGEGGGGGNRHKARCQNGTPVSGLVRLDLCQLTLRGATGKSSKSLCCRTMVSGLLILFSFVLVDNDDEGWGLYSRVRVQRFGRRGSVCTIRSDCNLCNQAPHAPQCCCACSSQRLSVPQWQFVRDEFCCTSQPQGLPGFALIVGSVLLILRSVDERASSFVGLGMGWGGCSETGTL